jgi:hypothetical protein
MTKEELYKKAIEELNIKEMHPIHKAMLEECCESALENSKAPILIDSLLAMVYVAFTTSNTALKAALTAAKSIGNADQITLNYRGQPFIISKDSYWLD